MANPGDERILVRDGRRHHRVRYSRTEFRIGLAALAVLGAVVAWVAWRGAHPDPALFTTPLAEGGGDREVLDARPAPEGTSAVRPAGIGETGAGPGASADRGPLPAALALPGWTEGGVSSFGPENLYEKINGREDYYKSFGFRRLWFVSLQHDALAERVVDVEAFDLAEPANALGAFAGERPEGSTMELADDGAVVLFRNALYVARGPMYVRAIGSDESDELRALLAHLRTTLEAALPGAPLPWAWALFVGELGFEPGAVAYTAENAFSFGFASDVWSARRADETELFVVAGADEAAAGDLARKFGDGFTEYGDAAGTSHGVSWASDRYLKTVSGAKATGRWTVGVYGAPDLATAAAELDRLEAAVRDLPLEIAR